MSAAATAAMFVVLDEERRRQDPDYEPLVSILDMPNWFPVAMCLIMIGWAVAMFTKSMRLW